MISQPSAEFSAPVKRPPGFPGAQQQRIPCNVRDIGSIPRSGISSGGGNGNPLQYSWLGDPMVRGAWWATDCGVAKSWMWPNSSCKRPFVLALILLPTGEKGGCSVAHMGNGVWEGLHVEEMEQLSFGTLLFPMPSWPFWNLACIAGARSPGTTFLELFAGNFWILVFQ